MTPKKPQPTQGAEFSGPLLEALVGFLYRAGQSKKEIEALVRDALKKLPANKGARVISSLDVGTASAIGAGFHRWFRSKTFIDSRGKPQPLPLLGPGKTVQSLIRSVGKKLPAEDISLELVRLGLVKRVGRNAYVPTEMLSLIRTNHPYLSEHIAHSILRFLHTVNDNANCAAGEVPLFERFAHVPAIPKSKLREFKDFSSQQGEALIDTVNDWLEANRAKPRGGSATTAQVGLHVFAYAANTRKSPRR